MNFFTGTKTVDLFEPKVEVKKRLKKIVVTGISRMPDPGLFYENISLQLKEYFQEFNRTLFIDFKFDYINTGTSKWLYFILKSLESELKANGGMIEVTWNYETDDESIEETGEVLQSQLSFPVILKAL
jgi:hypothetical protein